MERTTDPSTVHKSKRLKDEECQLPDSVLVNILSLLPTKDVVKMAYLPRFRHIWTFIHSFSFDLCAFHNHFDSDNYDGPNYDERFLNLIRRVLILHDCSTINKFHLKFTFNLFNVTHDDPDNSDYALKEKRMASELTTWIRFAMRKQVKVLDLDLLGCGLPEPEVNYELPKGVLTSNWLVELRLISCGIKGQERIQMRSLKKLFLKEILIDEKILGDILEGCPMLEELSLIGCSGIRKLNLTNPNIKRLNIFIGWKDVVEHLRMEIICPTLKSLEISGSIQSVFIKGKSSIVDASLCFSRTFKCERSIYEKVQMLLYRLVEAKVFRPCTWTVLVFTIWELTRVSTPRPDWKYIELKLLFTKWHLPGIHSILKCSHRLEALTLYIYPGSHSILMNDEARWMEEEYNFDGEEYWKSLGKKDTPICFTKNLKSVMIYGYVTKPYVFELIEFILTKAYALEKMVVSTKRTLFQPIHQYEPFTHAFDKYHFDTEELLEFSKKLLSIPRASKSAVVEFCS